MRLARVVLAAAVAATVVAAGVAAAGAAGPARKQLAGPPAESAAHALPDPLLGGVVSETSNHWVSLAGGAAPWTAAVPVEGPAPLLVLFARSLPALAIAVAGPDGAPVPLPPAAPVRGRAPALACLRACVHACIRSPALFFFY
jgi:hypothetical protein